MATRGGAVRVRNHVILPLLKLLEYDHIESAGEVSTREGLESGGEVLVTADGKTKLRVWCTDFEIDLDAPARRGSAYRYSHLRSAQRVLLTCGERLGLLTNGVELRLLISDPARPDSQITIAIDPYWKRNRNLPDSFLLLLALASPSGVKALPDLVEKARLQQARVTKELRVQARRAVESFIQEILDHPANQGCLEDTESWEGLAKQLWKEGLIIIYRLLFILKLETSDNTAQAFSFASTSLWRNSFSPSTALASYARNVLDDGWETGSLLESGMRSLFKMFAEGLSCSELSVKPLGGALFGVDSTPILSSLTWGERAIAHLLDQLLWTTAQRGTKTRERVHYGPLNVEDLGRVYEALLELEPGITTEPMCRLRRQKLEVVLPISQGEKYRPVRSEDFTPQDIEDDDEEIESEEEEETPKRGKKTKVEWIEEIPPNRFYLRVGLGRKASGSYYTPHSFVRFLVKETLEPQINERSPQQDPQPGEILKLKVLDPSMGSGHFLVEACRFLGDKLYEACRLCDELANEAEKQAEQAKFNNDLETFTKMSLLSKNYRQRVIDLPDTDDKLVKYLPSSAPEGEESGYSQDEAKAICRRLVAVHCLYGVDKNPLAVELAKLSLWLESHAEGLPLTFLDHRLVVGDSLTGPFFEHLLKEPGTQHDVQKLLWQNVNQQFKQAINEALKHIRDLEATIGIDISDLIFKQAAKQKLDIALAPFKIVAAAWAGGVMLGDKSGDVDYSNLVNIVGTTGDLPEDLADKPKLLEMIARGLDVENVPSQREDLLAVLVSGKCVSAFPYDLAFAEVFYPTGSLDNRRGFDAVLGNPPWDAVRPKAKEFFAAFDFDILAAPTKRERTEIENKLKSDNKIADLHKKYEVEFTEQHRIHDVIYKFQVVRINGDKTGGDPDAAKLFIERNTQLLHHSALTGVVIPSGFHANEGATGIRQLYFENMAIKCCYSFENRRKLFEIDSRFKFAAIIAKRGEITTEFPCAFYLHDDEWLFDRTSKHQSLNYTLDFVQKTGGKYLSLLELRSEKDLDVAKTCFANSESFGKVCDSLNIKLGRELHMTDDAWRFTPTSEILPEGKDPRDPDVAKQLLEMGYIILHEGKTFWHYDDRWDDSPRYLVSLTKLNDKYIYTERCKYIRLAYRSIASATNERTAIFSLLPAGITCGHSVGIEQNSNQRISSAPIFVIPIANSFIFDWCLRQMVAANVTQYLLFTTPIPFSLIDKQNFFFKSFLSHSALRLTCNHTGYLPLWREQLNEEWREPNKPPFTFPVLSTDDERWEIRAAIDAVVAQAYGLNRQQYAHILSTFSHKSYPKAPQLCLTYFDALQTIGIEEFTQKYDPYWDIPLNENLPQPVIELPLPKENQVSTEDGTFQLTSEPPKKTRRKK
ncbi:hypothetical protein [Anabaena catenula]|uniref:site-specific DNA-methyltransferase (adenine-specific) n=1 Tax=Anabaena catenula FACHB-362 TaxID=2692877 RepID=A0ABR8J7A2_9NOST|nr:hypothetical protein [Anabaena catenula]MBD2694251.1 hypothetical protein [Anabaena catenula FACHB-362]